MSLWFGLLCHISPIRLSSGHSSLIFTLKTNDAARASLPNPHSLLVDASVWAASPLVVAVRLVLCGFLFYFSSYVALWDSKSPHWLACERVSYCLETSPLWLPPQDKASISKSFVPVFIFYILSYILSRQLGCLYGCLVSSDSVQKLFYGSCSEFKWFFGELVGEKVSPCLIPSALWDALHQGLF